ncbi:MAG: GMP/IMP nucleotidase [Chromatiales bacterium]|nr:GMP/IMP nucleotidase [Chromatiales bacterium]
MSFQIASWQQIDTALLDMDGTLLDLAFDNYFWREVVPRSVARARGESVASAHARIEALYASKEGSLDWYCLDYWSAQFSLDMVALKHASSQRIRYLPGARDFLAAAVASGRRLVLVTNAHRRTLEVKRAVAGLDSYLDSFVSSHDFGLPKEHPDFWPALQAALDFDPRRTAFIDDSLPVLAAARDFGIRQLWAITAPDTRAAPRDIRDFPAIRGVSELL